MFKDISLDTLITEKSEDQLSKIIKEISDNFTKDRSKIGKYVADEDFVAAYSWFYMPTNKFKLDHLFSQIPQSLLEDIANRPFIDYGCGPGTYTWAMLDYFAAKQIECNQDIYLVDQSKLMLNQARKIHAFDYSEKEIINYLSQVPENSIDSPVLFFGNSINEIGFKQSLKIIKSLKPEIVIYIEPGTKDFFVTASSLRDSLIESGYNIAYPCPSKDSCPANAIGDWCHQVALPSYPESIHRKCQLTGLDRRSHPVQCGVQA